MFVMYEEDNISSEDSKVTHRRKNICNLLSLCFLKLKKTCVMNYIKKTNEIMVIRFVFIQEKASFPKKDETSSCLFLYGLFFG